VPYGVRFVARTSGGQTSGTKCTLRLLTQPQLMFA
jgi:hypothetical protein